MTRVCSGPYIAMADRYDNLRQQARYEGVGGEESYAFNGSGDRLRIYRPAIILAVVIVATLLHLKKLSSKDQSEAMLYQIRKRIEVGALDTLQAFDTRHYRKYSSVH